MSCMPFFTVPLTHVTGRVTLPLLVDVIRWQMQLQVLSVYDRNEAGEKKWSGKGGGRKTALWLLECRSWAASLQTFSTGLHKPVLLLAPRPLGAAEVE